MCLENVQFFTKYFKQNEALMKRNFNMFCKEHVPSLGIFLSLNNAFNASSVQIFIM